jgi:hypothetical protein
VTLAVEQFAEFQRVKGIEQEQERLAKPQKTIDQSRSPEWGEFEMD